MKIFSAAPTRVSLFGGGTDVDPYASKYGGVCVNLAINIRQKLIYYTGEDVFLCPKNIFPVGVDGKFCYKIWDAYKVNGMHHSRIESYFDGIVGAGLGSSAAFAVSMIGALKRNKGEKIDNEQVASEAFDIEKTFKHTGKQDMLASSFGGLNELFIGKHIFAKPLATNHLKLLLDSLVLVYSGIKRVEPDIQKNFLNLTSEKIYNLDRLKKIAIRAIDYIKSGDIEMVAKLLNQSWDEKKKTNEVSNKLINELYDLGMINGAWGGKLLGAGGGGYMVFIVDPNKRPDFVEKIEKYGLKVVDFSIDRNGLETRIL